MDLIRIEGLELRCIVGLRSYERHREQPLSLDISLGMDLSGPGRSGRISDSADYARVADEVTALLRFREYRLLEVAAEECAALLFASHPTVQQVRLRLDKPEALAGRARMAAVEITRSRGAFGATEEPTPYGSRIELLAEQEGIIELLKIDSGQELTLPAGEKRLEWITDSRRGGHPSGVAGGAPVAYGVEQTSHYVAGDHPLEVCRCIARVSS